MSVDYTRGPGDGPANTEADASMFAPTPIWDKGSRRRRGGRSRADDPMAAGAAGPDMGREEAMSPNGDAIAPRPRAAAPRRSSIAPAAIVVGVLVLAALAAAGWYATRSNTGMAQMTPGAPAGSVPATAITPNADAAMAANTTPSPGTAPGATTTQTTVTHHVTSTPSATTVRRHTTRSTTASPERSVTSTTATGAGVNTGAIAPEPRPSAAPPTLSVTPPSSTLAPSAPATAQPPPIAPPPSSATPSIPNTATPASPTPPGEAGTTAAPQGSPP